MINHRYALVTNKGLINGTARSINDLKKEVMFRHTDTILDFVGNKWRMAYEKKWNKGLLTAIAKMPLHITATPTPTPPNQAPRQTDQSGRSGTNW